MKLIYWSRTYLPWCDYDIESFVSNYRTYITLINIDVKDYDYLKEMFGC